MSEGSHIFMMVKVFLFDLFSLNLLRFSLIVVFVLILAFLASLSLCDNILFLFHLSTFLPLFDFPFFG